MRGLSKAEAELVSKIAPYVTGSCIFKRLDAYLEEHGVNFQVILSLQEIGVLTPGSMLSVQLNSVFPDRFVNLMKAPSGKCLLLRHDDINANHKYPCYMLSAIGKELLTMGAFEADEEYMRQLGSSLVKDGFKVFMGDWSHAENNMVNTFNLIEIAPPGSAA